MEGDEMCVVCGGPPEAPNEDAPEWDECLRALSPESLEWLNHYVGITEAEELIPLNGYEHYSSFAIDDYKGKPSHFACATYFRSEGIPWYPDDGPHGLTCHENCYKLLERDLHYTLRFRDVWPLLMQQEFPTAWLDWEVTDYGGMAAYGGEFFKYKQLYLDGNGWMFQDPLTHRANAERILKVWKPLIQSGFRTRPTCDDKMHDECEGGNESVLDDQTGSDMTMAMSSFQITQSKENSK
jgi:hypothetical protein